MLSQLYIYLFILQSAGEAVFVDDVPSPPNCLHGAFIYSSKPLARVRGISLKPQPRTSEVAAVISAKDIPREGENIGSMTIFGSEPLFADDLARCAGDLIAFVVICTIRNHTLTFLNLLSYYIGQLITEKTPLSLSR